MSVELWVALEVVVTRFFLFFALIKTKASAVRSVDSSWWDKNGGGTGGGGLLDDFNAELDAYVQRADLRASLNDEQSVRFGLVLSFGTVFSSVFMAAGVTAV